MDATGVNVSSTVVVWPHVVATLAKDVACKERNVGEGDIAAVDVSKVVKSAVVTNCRWLVSNVEKVSGRVDNCSDGSDVVSLFVAESVTFCVRLVDASLDCCSEVVSSAKLVLVVSTRVLITWLAVLVAMNVAFEDSVLDTGVALIAEV